MTNVGYATVQIIPSAKDFSRRIQGEIGPQAARTGKAAGGKMGSSMGAAALAPLKAAVGLAAGIGIGVAVGNGIKSGLKTAAFMEQAEISFETLLGSNGKAQSMLKELSAFAAKTPFELPGLVDNARGLIGAGTAAKDVIPVMTALGDASGALGLDQERMNRVMLAYNQIQTKGKVQSEELMQITEAGIPVWQLLSKATGKSAAELQKQATAGNLLAKDTLPLLTAQMEKDYGGSMAKQAQTLSGVWSTVTDTLNIAMATALKPLVPILTTILPPAATFLAGAITGTSDAIVGLAGILKPYFDQLALGFRVARGEAQPFQGQMSGFMQIGAGVAVAIGMVKDAAVALWTGLTQGVTIVGGVGTSFGLVGTAIHDTFGAVLEAITPLLPALGSAFATLAPVLLQAVQAFSPLGLILQGIAPILPTIAALFVQLATTIGTVLGQAIAVVAPILQSVVSTVSGVLVAIMPTVVSLVTALANAFSTVVPVVLSVVQALAPLVTTILSGVAPILVQLVKAVLPPVIKAFNQIVDAVVPVVSTLASELTPVIKALQPTFQTVFSIISKVIAGLAPVVSSVFGTIANVISAALTIVTGIIEVFSGLLTGNWSKVWSGLGKILSGAWELIVSAIRGAIDLVVQVFGGLLPKIVSALGDVGGWLFGIGKNIVQGLLNGIASLAGTVGSFFLSLLPGWIVGPFKAALGIHSPSRVFHALGVWIGKGLINGVDSTKEDVKSKMSDLAQKVKDGFAKVVDEQAAAQKKLKSLQLQLADVNPKSRTAASQRKKINAAIAEQKAIIAASKKVTKKGVKEALLSKISSTSSTLQRKAADLEKKNAAIDAQQAIVDDLKAQKVDFAKSVVDNTFSLGNAVTAFQKAVDDQLAADEKLTSTREKLQGQLDDLDKGATKYATDRQTLLDKIAASLTITQTSTSASKRQKALDDLENLQANLDDLDAKIADYNASRASIVGQLDAAQATTIDPVKAIIDNLASTVQQTEAFQGVLGQLSKMGLDADTYRQLVEAGVAGGGLDTAKALLASGSGSVQAIAELQGRLKAAATSLGASTSSQLYDAGINAAQGILDGLKKERDGIVAAMDDIADALVRSIKTKLDIHSPSRVLASLGSFAGQGLAKGATSTLGLITRAGSAMAGALVPAAPAFPSPSIGTSVVGALTGASGGDSLSLNYTQNGGQGLTAEQELLRAGRRLKQSLRK